MKCDDPIGSDRIMIWIAGTVTVLDAIARMIEPRSGLS
jgi:hypothetical protein